MEEPGGAGSGPPAAPRRGLLADASLSAVLAGLITVVVSCSGPLLVVLAAAAAGRLTDAQTASWVWAACVGSGVTCAVLSWWTRMPVITAFSTPGAAVLVGSLGDYTYPEAVGAFLVSGVLMALTGLTGVFGQIMRRVPPGIVAAMLAGVLFSFGVDLFAALDGAPLPVLAALATYLAVKQRSPRYAVAWALVAAVLATAVAPGLHAPSVAVGLTLPVFTAPEFTVSAVVGLAVPLAVVTMASQNAPGLGVLAACGYRPNDRLLITATGLASTALAPLGGHAVNLAAITAAISTGEESHRDPDRRYVAGLACGVFYLLVKRRRCGPRRPVRGPAAPPHRRHRRGGPPRHVLQQPRAGGGGRTGPGRGGGHLPHHRFRRHPRRHRLRVLGPGPGPGDTPGPERPTRPERPGRPGRPERPRRPGHSR